MYNHKYNFRLTPFGKSLLFPPLKNLKFFYIDNLYIYIWISETLLLYYTRMKENIITSILTIFIYYLIFSFIKWDLNIMNWGWILRLLFVFVTLYQFNKSINHVKK